jgi:magnesium-transporting ATPase (P-type)
MAFSGTLAAGRQGSRRGGGVGDATEIGRISGMLSEVESSTTPLMQQPGRASQAG